MLKVLIVGSFGKYAIERHYYNHFQKSFEVGIFDARSIFNQYYGHNFLNKILLRTGLSRIYNDINTKLLSRVDEFKPDILFVFKGMEIQPKTLIEIKDRGVVIFNYNPDNPFIFSGRGSGNKNITESIELYDAHLTYDTTIKNEIEKRYNLPVFILPFGFEINTRVIDSINSIEEIKKVCFIGNPDKFRAKFLSDLANSGIRIDVYGNHWTKYLKHENIDIFGPVYDDEMYKTLYKYRVQINYMRPHNMQSHNMRTFEIPAIGGIQLAPDTPDHKRYFEQNKEIFLYKNVEDCVQTIRMLLGLSDTEAYNIREASRFRCINSKYSYEDRAEYLSDIFNKFVLI